MGPGRQRGGGWNRCTPTNVCHSILHFCFSYMKQLEGFISFLGELNVLFLVYFSSPQKKKIL
jgi:hypothetical protein